MTAFGPATLVPTWDAGVLRPMDKIEVHRRGLRHMAVSVFVVFGGETLIQRRAMGKYHTPGLWANSCCTHPQWHEPPLACATRRLREELGLVGLAPRHCGQVEYSADVGGGMIENEVVDVFVAATTERLVPRPDPAEVMETRWVTLADLCGEIAQDPARFTPWLQIYLADHGATIFGTFGSS